MKLSRRHWQRTLFALGFAGLGLGVGLYARASMNVPSGIAYSGLLRNNGAVDSTPHTFGFDLLDDSGTPLCATDTRENLAVTDGRFDVPDLFKSCSNLDAILDTKSGLQVRITVDNTVLTPNQPIGTVPFAARARVAEALSPSTVVPVANGGTGSSTQSFVDLTSDQSVAGAKSFSGAASFGGTASFSSAASFTSTLDITALGGLKGNGVTAAIFGGMWCSNAGGADTGATYAPNPLTGGQSCPSGFTKYQLFYTASLNTCNGQCAAISCFICYR